MIQLPTIIEFKDVSHSFDKGKTWVLQNLSFKVVDYPDIGQFIVFLGQSGAGKSNILKFISGLQQPTKGEIYINEILQTNKTKNIPMVFQQYSSFPWLTVLENVELGFKFIENKPSKKEVREIALQLINDVGLFNHKDKYCKPTILSGGQLQRVAIARTLIANPPIILMDEPFGALDAITRHKMQEILLKLWKGKNNNTIIFVTHDISEALFLGDEINILHGGTINQRIKVPFSAEEKLEVKQTDFFNGLTMDIEKYLESIINF